MDIGFKNHLPEFLRTPEVRNAGSTDYGMPDVRKVGTAECRENARKCGTPEERREESEDGEENSDLRRTSELRRKNGMLGKSITRYSII